MEYCFYNQVEFSNAKSTPTDIQNEPQKFLYPLLKGQTLISTNIYSGSLCTTKEFSTPTQPSSSSVFIGFSYIIHSSLNFH